jgi:ribosomal protein S12 methylthiotransferase accessory factor
MPKNNGTRDESFSRFESVILKPPYSAANFLQQFLRPCGRFRSPLSLKDRLQLRVALAVAKLDVFHSAAVVPLHTTPPNWQILLNFLHTSGIIRAPEFSIRPQTNDQPKRYRYALRAQFDQTKSDGHDVSDGATGFGMSSDPEEAYSKAIGEMLERYFLSQYKKSQFIRTSNTKLKARAKRALDLRQLNGFLPWQKEKFPGFRSDEHSVFSWAKARELISNTDALVPAQLVYWGYMREKNPEEPYLVHSTSNGAAGHFTFQEAALKAMYENVERDGFLMFWLNTLSPPLLDIDSVVNQEFQSFRAELERYGLEVHFVDITTDIGIPSCICVLVDNRGDEPCISMGGSAGFNIEQNLISSMYEAASVHTGTSTSTPVSLSDPYEPFVASTIDRDARLKIWRGKEMMGRFQFFIEGKKLPLQEALFGKNVKNFESVEQEYSYVLDLFKTMGAGYELYCYEVKNSVLQKLEYCVVKIIIPQLMPLYLTENLATLDSKRLREVPSKLGYTETKLNPWPHPFP